MARMSRENAEIEGFAQAEAERSRPRWNTFGLQSEILEDCRGIPGVEQWISVFNRGQEKHAVMESIRLAKLDPWEIASTVRASEQLTYFCNTRTGKIIWDDSALIKDGDEPNLPPPDFLTAEKKDNNLHDRMCDAFDKVSDVVELHRRMKDMMAKMDPEKKEKVAERAAIRIQRRFRERWAWRAFVANTGTAIVEAATWNVAARICAPTLAFNLIFDATYKVAMRIQSNRRKLAVTRCTVRMQAHARRFLSRRSILVAVQARQLRKVKRLIIAETVTREYINIVEVALDWVEERHTLPTRLVFAATNYATISAASHARRYFAAMTIKKNYRLFRDRQAVRASERAKVHGPLAAMHSSRMLSPLEQKPPGDWIKSFAPAEQRFYYTHASTGLQTWSGPDDDSDSAVLEGADNAFFCAALRLQCAFRCRAAIRGVDNRRINWGQDCRMHRQDEYLHGHLHHTPLQTVVCHAAAASTTTDGDGSNGGIVATLDTHILDIRRRRVHVLLRARLQENRLDRSLWIRLGLCHIELQQFEEASEVLEKAVSMEHVRISEREMRYSEKVAEHRRRERLAERQRGILEKEKQKEVERQERIMRKRHKLAGRTDKFTSSLRRPKVVAAEREMESVVSDWVEVFDPQREANYYYNLADGKWIWVQPRCFIKAADHPLTNAAVRIQNVYRGRKDRRRAMREKEERAKLWVEDFDATTGCYFYYNTKTNESHWDKPNDYVDPSTSSSPAPASVVAAVKTDAVRAAMRRSLRDALADPSRSPSLQRALAVAAEDGLAWRALAVTHFVLWGKAMLLEENASRHLVRSSKAYTQALKFGSNRDNAIVLFEIAWMSELYGDFVRALQVYGKIIREFPAFPALNAVIFRAAVVLRLSGDLAQSSTYLAALVKGGDWYPPPVQDEIVLFQHALLHEAAGNQALSAGARSVASLHAQTADMAWDELYSAHRNQQQQYSSTAVITAQQTSAAEWRRSPDVWVTMAAKFQSRFDFWLAAESFQQALGRTRKRFPPGYFTDPRIRRLLLNAAGSRRQCEFWVRRFEVERRRAVRIQALERGRRGRMRAYTRSILSQEVQRMRDVVDRRLKRFAWAGWLIYSLHRQKSCRMISLIVTTCGMSNTAIVLSIAQARRTNGAVTIQKFVRNWYWWREVRGWIKATRFHKKRVCAKIFGKWFVVAEKNAVFRSSAVKASRRMLELRLLQRVLGGLRRWASMVQELRQRSLHTANLLLRKRSLNAWKNEFRGWVKTEQLRVLQGYQDFRGRLREIRAASVIQKLHEARRRRLHRMAAATACLLDEVGVTAVRCRYYSARFLRDFIWAFFALRTIRIRRAADTINAWLLRRFRGRHMRRFTRIAASAKTQRRRQNPAAAVIQRAWRRRYSEMNAAATLIQSILRRMLAKQRTRPLVIQMLMSAMLASEISALAEKEGWMAGSPALSLKRKKRRARPTLGRKATLKRRRQREHLPFNHVSAFGGKWASADWGAGT